LNAYIAVSIKKFLDKPTERFLTFNELNTVLVDKEDEQVSQWYRKLVPIGEQSNENSSHGQQPQQVDSGHLTSPYPSSGANESIHESRTNVADERHVTQGGHESRTSVADERHVTQGEHEPRTSFADERHVTQGENVNSSLKSCNEPRHDQSAGKTRRLIVVLVVVLAVVVALSVSFGVKGGGETPTESPTANLFARSCEVHQNCANGEVCVGDYCFIPCVTNHDCSQGSANWTCSTDKVCKLVCEKDSDCDPFRCTSLDLVCSPLGLPLPTLSPTQSPTKAPTKAPTTKSPSKSPTSKPTLSPTRQPTESPTRFLCSKDTDCDPSYFCDHLNSGACEPFSSSKTVSCSSFTKRGFCMTAGLNECTFTTSCKDRVAKHRVNCHSLDERACQNSLDICEWSGGYKFYPGYSFDEVNKNKADRCLFRPRIGAENIPFLGCDGCTTGNCLYNEVCAPSDYVHDTTTPKP